MKARLNTKNVECKEKEEAKVDVMDVPIFTEFNWEGHLKLRLNRLLARVWRFGHNIDPTCLDAYSDLKDVYFMSH